MDDPPPTYFARVGPRSGPIMDRDRSIPGSIGFHDSPDHAMPIGEAHAYSADEQGRSVFRLVIGKAELPGRWVCVDRGFRGIEWQ